MCPITYIFFVNLCKHVKPTIISNQFIMTPSTCPRCHNIIPSGASFCPGCGLPVQNDTTQLNTDISGPVFVTPPPISNRPEATQPLNNNNRNSRFNHQAPRQRPQERNGAKKGSSKIWLYIIIAVLAVALGTTLALLLINNNNSTTYTTYTTDKTDKDEDTAIVERLYPNSVSGNCDHDNNKYYYASHLIDGDVRSCWALDLRPTNNYYNHGFAKIVFNIPCKRLDHIVLYNGYQKNTQNYYDNNRAKHIVMYNADDMSQPILDQYINDTMSAQTLNAIDNSANRDITTILMTFPDDFYYKGNKWNDFCISEIQFYGTPL